MWAVNPVQLDRDMTKVVSETRENIITITKLLVGFVKKHVPMAERP